MFWLYQDSSRGGHEFHGTASDEHWDFPLAKWKLYLLLLFMMWFWAVSHQLRWDNDPPDAPVRLKCEEQTFVFVYFTILKIICSSLRQYREPLVTLHPSFFPLRWQNDDQDRKMFLENTVEIMNVIFLRLLSEHLLRESHHFSRLDSSLTNKHLQQFGNKISEGSCSHFVSESKELWRMCFSFWLATWRVSQLYL